MAAEDQLVGRAVGAAESRKSVFLLHVLGNLEPPQRFDLPLRGPLPYRIGAPEDVIDTNPLEQRADQGPRKFRMRHGRIAKRGAEIRVDVRDTELFRYLAGVRRPLDA